MAEDNEVKTGWRPCPQRVGRQPDQLSDRHLERDGHQHSALFLANVLGSAPTSSA